MQGFNIFLWLLELLGKGCLMIEIDIYKIRTYSFIVLLYTFLSLALTFPLALHIGSGLDNMGDPALNVWVLTWDVHSIFTDPLNVFNANIFYPFTENTLAFSEHLLGDMIIALPVMAITGNPVFSYNIIFILSFILSAVGMFLLIDYYLKNKYSAFVGGLVFAFCTIRFAHLGHLQFLTAQWMPFSLLYLDKFLHKSSYKNMILLYVFYVLQVLSSWYYAFYISITLAAYAAFFLAKNGEIGQKLMNRSFQLKSLMFLILSMATVAPFAVPYVEVALDYGFIRGLDEVSYYSADVRDYFLTVPSNILYGMISWPVQPARGEGEHALFPGLTVVALSMYGIIHFKKVMSGKPDWISGGYIGDDKQSFFLILAILASILSLGTPLHFFGHVINIDLPYKYLYDYLPVFKSLRVPSRFGIVVMLSLSVLAGYGLNRIIAPRTKNEKTLISLLFVLFILAENLYVPVSVVQAPSGQDIPEVYKWLANENDTFAIVEMPTGYFTSEGNNLWYDVRYLYYSIYHWRKLINGYSGFFPNYYYELLGYLQTFPTSESLNILQQTGIKYVIIHKSEMDPAQWNRLFEDMATYNQMIKLVKKFGQDYVYELDLTKRCNITTIPLFRTAGRFEEWNGVRTRWLRKDDAMIFYSNEDRRAELSFQAISFYQHRTLELSGNGCPLIRADIPSNGFVAVRTPISLKQGQNFIRFHVLEGCERPSDKPELNSADRRCLSIALQNITIS